MDVFVRFNACKVDQFRTAHAANCNPKKQTSLGEISQNRCMLQMTLIIKGKVQRVGFRYSVVDHVISQKLPIVGHVRNLPDGSVKVLAQGDIEALKELHRFCTTPSHAEVREVTEDLVKIKGANFSEFTLISEQA